MKKLTVVLALLIFALVNIAADNISGRLKAEIKMKEKIVSGELKEIPNLIKNAPSFDTQLIFVHFAKKPTKNFIKNLRKQNVEIFPKSWIPPCKNHPTGFFTARIPAKSEMLKTLANISEIKMINSAEENSQFFNDLAAIETGASAVAESPYNLTGEGVRISVIDSGYQLDHPDMPEAVIAVDYSNYIAEPDSDFTVSNESTHIGHGTHVAGTILGQGTLSNGVWKGMAPGADFIAIKVGHDNTGMINNSALVHSIYASRFYYNADLINLSLGRWDDYHDGSSEEAQTVDLVSEDGCLVFAATGNSADEKFHYSNILEGNALSDFIAIDYHDTTDTRTVIYNLNLVWYDSPDTEVQNEMTMLFYNDDFEPLFVQDVEEMTQSPRGTQSRFGTATVFGNNSFYVRVMNQSSETMRYHLYIASGNGEFTEPDPHYTVATPADASLAISVGSYNSRIEWTNWEAITFHMLEEEIGDLSSFSNRGPRIDEMIAPKITAPGLGLISIRDDDAWGGPPFGLILNLFVISNSYADGNTSGGLPADYLYLTGTSMAAPAACGSVALIKEYAPYLSREELVELITDNARSDGFTGEVPNFDWGYGKLDVEAAISELLSADEETIENNSITVYRNFPNPFQKETTIKFVVSNGNRKINLDIFNIKGQKVRSLVNSTLNSGNYSILWNGLDDNGKRVSNGVYFYKVSSENFTSVKKMILMK